MALQWNDGCDALVDFVEEHGGSMGGESRDHLFNIVQHILDGQAVLDAPQEPSDQTLSEKFAGRVQNLDELEAAWGIIANAYHGDWDSLAPKDWREAAERWRDRYHEILSGAAPLVEPCPIPHRNPKGDMESVQGDDGLSIGWFDVRFCFHCGASLGDANG